MGNTECFAICSWMGFVGCLSAISLSLQLFLAISTSAYLCERSFTKQTLLKRYLQPFQSFDPINWKWVGYLYWCLQSDWQEYNYEGLERQVLNKLRCSQFWTTHVSAPGYFYRIISIMDIFPYAFIYKYHIVWSVIDYAGLFH